MEKTFIESILFQARPDKVSEFETMLAKLVSEMQNIAGCISVRCFKRFYTFDGVELGEPPRELTKVVKCVKYYAHFEFDSIENCGKANGWIFDNYSKQIIKLLVAPFDINCGYSI